MGSDITHLTRWGGGGGGGRGGVELSPSSVSVVAFWNEQSCDRFCTGWFEQRLPSLSVVTGCYNRCWGEE